jgi:hypothetical protein
MKRYYRYTVVATVPLGGEAAPSLMDSNSIHGPSAQNMWRNIRKVLETDFVLMIFGDSNFC